MKYIILAFFFTFTLQQTIFTQLQCSMYNCQNEFDLCFNENNTDCATYGATSMTECGATTLDDLYSQISSAGLSILSDAKMTDSMSCMIGKTDNQQFENFAICLANCTTIIPFPNSLIGLQLASINQATVQLLACRQDVDCQAALMQLINSEVCQNCSFFPQNWLNWNLPLTNSDAVCYSQCYSPNNVDNTLLKEFLEATENVKDSVTFVDDYIPIDDEEDSGEQKLLQVLIEFIVKMFQWLVGFFKRD